jgi:hypothetical protein
MTKNPTTFPTEIEAAKHLLAESTRTLQKHGVEFAVVGGWSPLLFHSSKYGHPGTFDVDVLLHEKSLDDGSFDKASDELLTNGYLRAPKNVFQAHRVLNVANEDLVFHIDFLNEREPGNAIELVGGKGRMKSIYTEAMRAVFAYKDYRFHPSYSRIRFPSPETFIVTKAAAAVVKKRKRDAFDIFVTIQDQDADALRKRWSDLCNRDGLFSNANDALYEAVHNGDAIEKISAVLQDMQTAGLLKVPLPREYEIVSAFAFLIDA